ncbi:MAG: hypothetical protein ACI4GZ_04555 [Ruminococcus sp.]
MYKKMLSFVLALVLVAGMAVIGVSAAEADEVPETSTTIYFELPEEWAKYAVKKVFCHIWEIDGDALGNWQSKPEACTSEGNNLYSYNISKVGEITEGKYYGVIFSVDTGAQTYDTLLTTDCLGGTVYCGDTHYENPQDSAKTVVAAFWRNMNPEEYGPIKVVSSIGNVVGTCLVPGTTEEDLFNDFLNNKLDNARTYSGLTDQQLIDNLGLSLGFTREETHMIILASDCDIDWSKENSIIQSASPDEATPDESTPDESTPDEPIIDSLLFGDADLDGRVSVKDVTLIQKHSASIVFIDNQYAQIAANVVYTDSINVKDATAIQKYLAGIDTGLPIGVDLIEMRESMMQ